MAGAHPSTHITTGYVCRAYVNHYVNYICITQWGNSFSY